MIINKLEMDLNRCGVAPTIDAVQGDVCSRSLEIFLHSAGKPFVIPENLAVLIRYKKADGKGGEYDTLPDGTSAWNAQGNILTLTLAPQVLTFPGEVFMTIALIAEGKQLSTFPLRILVQPSAQPLMADSEEYFRVTGFLAAPGSAKKGQYLQVTSVDASGRVTGIAAADVIAGGSGAPSDWDAEAGQPGYIRNRPFYSEYLHLTLLEPVMLTASEETDGMGILPSVLELTDGMKCTVLYNGTAYDCIAQPYHEEGISAFTLGNMSTMGGEDTGEPFAILCLPQEIAEIMGMPGMVMPLDGSTTFTLSITGVKETVHPLPEKYLGNARAQKKITLDLDNNTASVPIDQTIEMDTAELQAAISVIYKGTEHSAVITDRIAQEYQGILVARIEFVVIHSSSHNLSNLRGVSVCQWSSFDGVSVQNENTFMPAYSLGVTGTESILVHQGGAGMVPHWRKIADTPLSCIVLKSTTANSAKKFRITVDDTGTLSVTQVSL